MCIQYLPDLRQYVTDLASIPRLSREETRQLTARLATARQGRLSPEQAACAKQRLIEGHLWLAVALVKRSGAHLRSLSPLDLVQQGTIGLLRACDRFDFASGGNFTAYAILDALLMENTIKVSAEGLPVTMARLCSRAHVGSRAAAFLKHYHPAVRPTPRPTSKGKPARPAKATPQERLGEAYTRLVAQGEQVTRARLRHGQGEHGGRRRVPAGAARG